ncbi:hypothetical protein GP486_001737 [Trichoglossum hirsutum]|uniref:Phospholipid-transporting ATPase n=1 Tax=Trichoglossum hirsutum TaxID=265104 RepID=A0A9P8LFK6_9PEZI|nr:hypothetical protein GP486_001737 [Trichoglossum hirsutum]
MIGNEHRDAVNSGSIRRRHSSHHGEDNLSDGQEVGDFSQAGRASIDNPPRSSSATGAPVPRVRFSADLDRVQPVNTLPLAQHQPPSASTSQDVTGSRTIRRPGITDLTVDTRPFSESSDVGQNISSQYRSATSPRLSPTSPKARGRGYSLRRTLFTRSITEQASATDPSPDDVARLDNTDSSITELRSEVFPRYPAEESHPASGQEPKRKLPEVTARDLSHQESQRLPDISRKGHASLALSNYASWRSRSARIGVLGRIRSVFAKARKIILRINELPPSKDGRKIDLDAVRKSALIDERTGREYISNIIRSSRYTLWNFLPRQLFAQFSKLANFYFLIISILQLIPGLSTTGTFTTIVPLLFFVSISMAKEGYDDLRRYRLDKAENNREALVLHAHGTSPSTEESSSPTLADPKHWVATKWKDIQVGDIIRLRRDEPTPADLVILHSKSQDGVAYIETMALDGETNLKSKRASPPLAKNCCNIQDLAKCKARIVVEDPNLDLYNFEGKVVLGKETSPLTNNEIIYRGSILRNTEESLGMVIYTGEECKIRMNATKNLRIKAPSLQSIVNKVVIIIVVFVMSLAIFHTVAYQLWADQTEDKSWYLSNASVSFFPILASFIIMFNTMIPLSLYVSLEIIKLAQMYFLNDIDMYDASSDTPMEARTSTINEELGQVR